MRFTASDGSCDVRPAWEWAYGRALSKEIKYIAEHTTVCLIDLCISASGTGYSGKLFALNIEYFTPKASCGSEHSCFILVILTLRTPVTDIIHELFSFGPTLFCCPTFDPCLCFSLCPYLYLCHRKDLGRVSGHGTPLIRALCQDSSQVRPSLCPYQICIFQ